MRLCFFRAGGHKKPDHRRAPHPLCTEGCMLRPYLPTRCPLLQGNGEMSSIEAAESA